MGRIARIFLLLAAVPAACRSVTTSFDYPEDLRHPNYVKRTLAAREFAARKDRERLPEAFSLLLDEEPHIRVLAHETIRALSGGEDFGYRPYLPPADRLRITEQWRTWWTKTAAAEASGG